MSGAERKLATIVFADLVGSTTLVAGHRPRLFALEHRIGTRTGKLEAVIDALQVNGRDTEIGVAVPEHDDRRDGLLPHIVGAGDRRGISDGNCRFSSEAYVHSELPFAAYRSGG